MKKDDSRLLWAILIIVVLWLAYQSSYERPLTEAAGFDDMTIDEMVQGISEGAARERAAGAPEVTFSDFPPSIQNYFFMQKVKEFKEKLADLNNARSDDEKMTILREINRIIDDMEEMLGPGPSGMNLSLNKVGKIAKFLREEMDRILTPQAAFFIEIAGLEVGLTPTQVAPIDSLDPFVAPSLTAPPFLSESGFNINPQPFFQPSNSETPFSLPLADPFGPS